jgi:hypothetical protein
MAAAGIDTGKCSSRPVEVTVDITSPFTKACRWVETLVDGKMVLRRVHDVGMQVDLDDEGNLQGLRPCSTSSSSSSDLPPILSQYSRKANNNKKDKSSSEKGGSSQIALDTTRRDKRRDSASASEPASAVPTKLPEEQGRKHVSDMDDSYEQYIRWSDMYKGDDYEEDRERMAAMRALFKSPPSPTIRPRYTVASEVSVQDTEDDNPYAGERQPSLRLKGTSIPND